MLDSNYQNKSCGFGEDLVAYLYDEIGENEKTKFERHLSSCQNCEKELSSFGFVRTSINDWKAKDFVNASLPKIEIEYGEIEPPVQTVTTEKSGWFDSLIGIFSGLPTWANASAGFAVLAICAVIAVIAYNNSGIEEISNNPEQKSIEQTKPVDDKVISPQKEEIATKQKVAKESANETGLENKTPKSELVSNTEISTKSQKRNLVTKQKSTLAKTKKRENKVVEYEKPDEQMTANNSDQKNYKNNLNEQEVPKLSNFVEEEIEESDSIRLTDLFDEVGNDK